MIFESFMFILFVFVRFKIRWLQWIWKLEESLLIKKKKQRGWWGEGIEHILTDVLDFNKLW